MRSLIRISVLLSALIPAVCCSQSSEQAIHNAIGGLFKALGQPTGTGAPQPGPTSQTRKRDPRTMELVLSADEAGAINIKAIELWEADGKPISSSVRGYCESAAQQVIGEKLYSARCTPALNAAVRDEQERRRAAARANRLQQDERQREARLAELRTMRDEIDEIVRQIDAGDASGWDRCAIDGRGQTREVEFYNACVPAAQPAVIRSLRAKKFPPLNCHQWEFANTKDGESLSSAMLVSINSDGRFGSFSGEVMTIEGKTVTLYDSKTRANAVAVIDGKTQIFNGEKVAVGLQIYGVGVQTGTRQLSLVSGQASTVAVISAKCIADF